MAPRHIVHNYMISLCVSMCMIQYGYDATLFSNVQILPSWTGFFNNPSPAVIGAVTTTYNVLAVVFGFFISPIISDNHGRKFAMGQAPDLSLLEQLS